jgi:hypothetical protein
LLVTLRLARHDERSGPGELPLLFRVDQEAGLRNGRRYVVDCGARQQCNDSTLGVVCLHHLAGAALVRRDGWRSRGPFWGGHGGCGGGGG